MKKLTHVLSLLTVPFALAAAGCAVGSGAAEESEGQAGEALTAGATANARIVDPQLPTDIHPVHGTTRGEAQIQVLEQTGNPQYQSTKHN